jgi:hypothetical protein
LRGVAEQGAIASPAHIRDNALYHRQDRIQCGATPTFQRSDARCCFPCSSTFGANQFHRSFR